MNQAKTNKPQLIILLPLVSLASVGAVLFTPALPAITAFFNVSIAQGQLTITSYLIGYALGQLPYGPLANRLGRKPTLYIGISVATLGSLLCALSSTANSFELLVAARFLQAIGACVGLKISFTMIADVYEQSDATKMLSKVLIAFAIMPGIGVAIGGWLTEWINWQSCFYFLALFDLIVLWIATKLPETAKSLDRSALNLPGIIRAYAETFKNRALVLSGLMMGCGTAIIYIFASKAPFIGIALTGLSPDLFGSYNLIPVAGMLFGALLSAKFSGRFPLLRLLLSAIIASVIVTGMMLIPFLREMVNPLTLFLPAFGIYLISPFIYANIASFGLAEVQNKANGSAVINFLNLSTSVVGVLLIEFIYPESPVLLPISIIVAYAVMFLLWLRLKKIIEGVAA